LTRRKQREQKPPSSNRGRPGARGVFLIFDRTRDAGERQTPKPRVDADEPLARDADADADTDRDDAA